MLKPNQNHEKQLRQRQPPSGGCVLKHSLYLVTSQVCLAAAFRRLCVETQKAIWKPLNWLAAAFRRLCVETYRKRKNSIMVSSSRLQAAVC